jgi:N-methylhydantoinase A
MYAEFLPLMAQHGVDHRAFGLLAYGGAGPTHAFLLAREVGIRTLVVPPSPGTLCALGCVLADLRADFVRTVYARLDEGSMPSLAVDLASLEEQARAWLVDEGAAQAATDVVRWADLRYRGQSFEVAVQMARGGLPGLRELPELFHARHQSVYGFNDPRAAVEVINLRVQAVGSVPGSRPDRLVPRPSETARPREHGRRPIVLDGQTLDAAVVHRDALRTGDNLEGPAVIVQYDTTTFVPPGFRVHVDDWLNLIGEQR